MHTDYVAHPPSGGAPGHPPAQPACHGVAAGEAGSLSKGHALCVAAGQPPIARGMEANEETRFPTPFSPAGVFVP
jgi:hypothetical protein